MSMSSLERAIWKEFKEVTGLEKTRLKDLQEWSTVKIEGRDDEVTVHLPGMGVWVAFKKAV